MSSFLANVSGIMLTKEGVTYDVPNGFFSSLRTGLKRQEGFTPIQHVNAVEYSVRRSQSLLSLILGVLALGYPIFQAANNPYFGYYGVPTVYIVMGGVGLALILSWLFLTEKRIIIYSEGTPFVSAKVGGSSDVQNFLHQYQLLKTAAQVTPARSLVA